MNKYVIVSLLEDVPEVPIESSKWPLHLTLLGNFYSDTSVDELSKRIKEICFKIKPFQITGRIKNSFGPESSVSVTEVVPSSKLSLLHKQLINILEDDSQLESPEHNGGGYRPHVTDQVTSTLSVAEKRTVRSLYLFEFKGSTWSAVEKFTLKE